MVYLQSAGVMRYYPADKHPNRAPAFHVRMRQNMTTLSVFRLATLVFCMGLSLTAAALPAPLSSGLRLEANSNFDFNFDPPNVSDIDSRSQGVALNPMSVAVDALITDPNKSASLRTHGHASAQWSDPSRGEVLFPELGWEVENASRGLVYLVRETALPTWSYRFIPDANGLFLLNYSFTGTPDSFPPEGERFDFDIGGMSAIVAINTSGKLSLPVLAGQLYEAELSLRYGLTFTASPLPTTFSDAASAAFQWEIVAIPEPAMPALAVGILLVVMRGGLRTTRLQ